MLLFSYRSCAYAYVASVNQALGPVHTKTFPCVFVLFTVLKGIETIQKRYKNAGKRFRVHGVEYMFHTVSFS